ncbi:MAG TPA: heme exporter protein CcmB [Saprospiraceae bacterium]|nr:heme exporter protein CcmB [Saprospiraceae bacterium]HRO07593.1 heme exporter protein CcmB [Saprospiraceae bacterium]HRO73199.1 heme exporter protein CcmB [Saprospiraceae bacterium]HRP40876.1 heme exporter protein CcmB [Saprospiraceae bacterium]
MNVVRVKDIFVKELSVDFRMQYALASIFLFAATIVFVIYKSFNNINPREWVIMLWVIMLFAALNAIVKSFLQEKKETYLYYYTLFNPIDLLIAKLVYNFVFLVSLLTVIILIMTFFSGFPVKDLGLFTLGSLLGIAGISVVFTFVSIMSSSGGGHSTLMSILALPLVLPILLLLLKISTVSVRLIVDTSVGNDVMLLLGVDCILLGAVFMLFPMLWRS